MVSKRYLSTIEKGSIRHVVMKKPSLVDIRNVRRSMLKTVNVNVITIILNHDGISELASLLLENPHLTEIHIKSMSVTSPHTVSRHTKQFNDFFSALAFHPSINTLSISSVLLRDVDFSALGECLEKNPRIKSLKLCNTGNGESSDHLFPVLDGLSKSNAIEDLVLTKFAFVSDASINSLVKLISTSSSLRWLSIAGFPSRPHSTSFFDRLSKALQTSKSIVRFAIACSYTLSAQHLNTLFFVDENTLSPFGLHLERLYIGYTPIGDEGAFSIAHFLSKSVNITHLDLPNCDLSGRGLAAIGNAIYRNVATNLSALGISYNRIFEGDGLTHFLQCIEKNVSLLDIQLLYPIGTPQLPIDHSYSIITNFITNRNHRMKEGLFDALVQVVGTELGECCDKPNCPFTKV